MTSDTSTSAKFVEESTTPAAHKAAKEGNPQQLLEKLPAMLHGVVIFKNPTKQHPRAILHTNAVMRATIPATVDRFQQALDMLEIEILKAKAVLHRDLTKFYTAAELARQKELEEEERKAALEREAEAERMRIQKQSEDAERAIALAAAAPAPVPPTIDLEMTLDEEPPASAQPPPPQPLLQEQQQQQQQQPVATTDADMDQLFEDMQDVSSLKVEEDASGALPLSAAGTGEDIGTGIGSHPLEMTNIPLVAPSASKSGDGGLLVGDDKLSDIKIKTDGMPSSSSADAEAAAVAAAVAATFEDPIILDSPLLPSAEGDAEEPSAVDLFGEDPLNPAADGKDSTSAVGGAGDIEQIDIDFLFSGDTAGGATGGNANVNVASTVDDLFGDLTVDGVGGDDAGKLDIMNLDIPGLGGPSSSIVDQKVGGKPGDDQNKQQVSQADVVAQPDIDILADPSSFDDLLASFGDGALLGQLGNDETSLFDDAFDIYNNP
ncbi:hypothetical protein ABW20_dc0101321 [Dactylellina cionopaga]|nr:hypothetical protein ABW20_dc0101321 [Dactylellina cionopaga]